MTLHGTSISSETARLALVQGWFELADEARQRSIDPTKKNRRHVEMSEARVCVQEAFEFCINDELRAHLMAFPEFYAEAYGVSVNMLSSLIDESIEKGALPSID